MSFETAANPDAKATAPRATVYIVDDDPSVHSSLVRLLNAYSYETKTFTSAHADARASTQAIEVGAVAFLSKPFDLQVMLNAIETATSKSLVQAKKYIPR